jgi:hypothetical protein
MAKVLEPVQASEILDGVLLSDGGIYLQKGHKNPHFSIGLSENIHLDWLNEIKTALITLGVNVSETYPALYDCCSHGKGYVKAAVTSSETELLEQSYERWYDNGIKVVPCDLILTPLTVAHWFMGDGSSCYAGMSIQTRLHTNKFLDEEVSKLLSLLQHLGVNYSYRTWQTRAKTGSREPVIQFKESNSVQVFMDLIKPYVCESFQYKIKYPRL